MKDHSQGPSSRIFNEHDANRAYLVRNSGTALLRRQTTFENYKKIFLLASFYLRHFYTNKGDNAYHASEEILRLTWACQVGSLSPE